MQICSMLICSPSLAYTFLGMLTLCAFACYFIHILLCMLTLLMPSYFVLCLLTVLLCLVTYSFVCLLQMYLHVSSYIFPCLLFHLHASFSHARLRFSLFLMYAY